MFATFAAPVESGDAYALRDRACLCDYASMRAQFHADCAEEFPALCRELRRDASGGTHRVEQSIAAAQAVVLGLQARVAALDARAARHATRACTAAMTDVSARLQRVLSDLLYCERYPPAFPSVYPRAP